METPPSGPSWSGPSWYGPPVPTLGPPPPTSPPGDELGATAPPYLGDDAPPALAAPPPEPPSPRAPEGGGARRLRRAAATVVVALLAGSSGALVTMAVDDDPVATTGAGPPGQGNAAARALQLDGDALDVGAVVAKAEPSVVSIQVQLRGGSGAGTGVILTADGEVLTNAHVVEGATVVTVTLAGESQARTADVVGSNAAADLALLKIRNASGLPTAELGKSAGVAVGDDVVAIGNALALRGGPTVTRGIISGLDRSLDTEDGTMTGLLQTDASISSGNSGGPLLDATGKVIGINTAVATSGRGSSAENIGFAIPIDQAIPIVERLRGNQAAARVGYLGVTTADPDDGSRGATVVRVETGSPAAGAGVRTGDLITHVDDKAVDGAAALSSAVKAHQPGETVKLRIVRGSEITLSVTLGTTG